MPVRRARADEFVDVMGVLEGALDVDAATVRERLAAEDVLVAERDGRIAGALVLTDAPRDGDRKTDGTAADAADSATDAGGCDGDAAHVAAVAVRPHRRGAGLGAALVSAAAAGSDELTADFDARVRPFYDSLGFECREHDGRIRGRLRPSNLSGNRNEG